MFLVHSENVSCKPWPPKVLPVNKDNFTRKTGSPLASLHFLAVMVTWQPVLHATQLSITV